ncbi:hypothetical protein BFP70_00180 [Thioclava sp. SK-1]|uniref:pilus assembly protein TadG-related protein n=1 Tax=Thioclava sp. SK-1 TaxID=1889770 RepID=UPI000825E7C7|nr:pilus assembly protein TadG-related protein [Thioclava sp. SK-1]OCX66625.1 hypothetical protein BFP70_00180 [Thioclava sp. SK-1]
MFGLKSPKWSTRPFGQRLSLHRLRSDEDGALMILSLQLFILMLVTTGIAIDLVRHEERRTEIQATLDRAALAAASLSQDLDPYDVVDDYMLKAGLGDLKHVTNVEESDIGAWRRVTITVDDDMPTIFGPLVGVTSLSSDGRSQAEESVGNVEIALVLDISGSMNYNINNPGSAQSGVSPTRMERLRPAATNFVNRMFDAVQPPDAPAGRLMISVVPYNQNVVLGNQLAAQYDLSADHSQNTCADVMILPTNTIAISDKTALQRTMFGDSFDYIGQAANGLNFGFPTTTNIQNCQENAMANVLAFSNDEATIVDTINKLTPGGDTAIDVGARWGMALLDPASQPIFDGLGRSGGGIENRPFNYDDGTQDVSNTAMKVLVLMTDGENTRSYSTKAAFRTGQSWLYSANGYTLASNELSDIRHTKGKGGGGGGGGYQDTSCSLGSRFFHSSAVANILGRSDYADKYYSYSKESWYTLSQINNCGISLNNISWQNVWSSNYTLQYVLRNYIKAPVQSLNSNVTEATLYDYFANQSEFADKDTDLKALCKTAKSHDIKVFTVAVSAPTAGQEILKQCASGADYVYDVDSSEVLNAFAEIASSINSLRLTN